MLTHCFAGQSKTGRKLHKRGKAGQSGRVVKSGTLGYCIGCDIDSGVVSISSSVLRIFIEFYSIARAYKIWFWPGIVSGKLPG